MGFSICHKTANGLLEPRSGTEDCVRNEGLAKKPCESCEGRSIGVAGCIIL